MRNASTDSIGNMIKFSYRTDKALFIAFLVKELAFTAGVFIDLYLVKLIINSFAEGKTKEEIFILCLIALLTTFVLSLIRRFANATISNHYRIALYKRNIAINKKTMNLDYEFLEDANIHLNIKKIQQFDNFGNYGVYHITRNAASLVSGCITAVLAICFSLKLFIIHSPVTAIPNWLQNSIFIFLFALINFIAMKLLSDINVKMQKLMSGDILFINTLTTSYIRMLEEYKSGKDIRIYNYNLFNSVLLKTEKNVNLLYTSMSKIISRSNALISLMNMIALLLVYLYAGLKGFSGEIQAGDIVQYTGIATQASSAIIMIMNAVSAFGLNKEYFSILFGYLNLDAGKYRGTLPVEKRDDNEYEFEFKNVSFKYPKTEKYVLKNVNLKFKIGKRLAIVGMNGSGKTTLIKLLIRLYDVTDGEILLNGINIKKYDYGEYLSLFSVVFQDFKLFSFSLAENVAASETYDAAKLKAVLKKCGLAETVKNFPYGVDTYLYKNYEEDGVEISGGEAQKIAMTRALYKDAPFIILDEPTAALDPISEYEIYSHFDEITGSKTAVFISHRLSSCRFCSEIAVFDEGALVQLGSHETLLQDKSGKYAELWNAQAQYYKPEEAEVLLKEE